MSHLLWLTAEVGRWWGVYAGYLRAWDLWVI